MIVKINGIYPTLEDASEKMFVKIILSNGLKNKTLQRTEVKSFFSLGSLTIKTKQVTWFHNRFHDDDESIFSPFLSSTLCPSSSR